MFKNLKIKVRNWYDKQVINYIYYKGKLVERYHGFLKTVSMWLYMSKIKLQSAKIKINHAIENAKIKINNGIDSIVRFIDSFKKVIDAILLAQRIKKLGKLETKTAKIKDKLGFNDSPEV